jgi:general secretion pathway protein H
MRRSTRSAGFTLIELLLVMVIAGVLLALIAVSSAPSPQRSLKFEADRLAQVLSLAREVAQVRGLALRFEATETEYHFLALREREWQLFTDDRDLRARPWEQPTKVTLIRDDTRVMLEFGRDSVDKPFQIKLVRDTAEATIKANGIGEFAVE